MRPSAEAGLRLAGLAGCLALWEAAARAFAIPAYVLPPPSRVAGAFLAQPGYFGWNGAITAGEILLGLALGAGFGAATALALALSATATRLVWPALVASQALPVFAIAPLLVIWLGFGLASKVAMAALIIYFPVVTTFADGLARTDRDLLDAASISGAGRLQTLRLVRLPAALPALGSGLKVAATVAPIGAVVGEWVGAAGGLGFVMLQANARSQTDKVFVALALLALLALLLRAAVEHAVERWLIWPPRRQSE